MILWIRTDQPEAVIQLSRGSDCLAKHQWLAQRELSSTLIAEITALMEKIDINFSALEAVCVYGGPGSFTGLRIGITVANTIGYSLAIPVHSVNDHEWSSLEINHKSSTSRYVVPEYGQPVRITQQKK